MDVQVRHPFDLTLIINLHRALSYKPKVEYGETNTRHRDREKILIDNLYQSPNLCRSPTSRAQPSAEDTSTTFHDLDLFRNLCVQHDLAEPTSKASVTYIQADSHDTTTPLETFKPEPENVITNEDGIQEPYISKQLLQRTNVPKHSRKYSPFFTQTSIFDAEYANERSPFPIDRKAMLVEGLIKDFPFDAPTLLRSSIPYNMESLVAQGSPAIHVFVDHSNILIGFLNEMKAIAIYRASRRTRSQALSFHNLSIVLERGRKVAKRVLVGSTRASPSIREAGATGYETCILERVAKITDDSHTSSSDVGRSKVSKRKREQMVDELLQMKMLESLLDHPPSVAVLATGDAAIAEYSSGFSAVVNRAISLGWQVELVAFRQSISKYWGYDHGWGNKFRIITLDPYILGLYQ